MDVQSLHLDHLPEREIWPGFHGKLIHTDHMTFAYWRIDQGAQIHKHAHHHEQVVNMLEGEFELIVDGQSTVCRPGDIIVIPSNVPHEGTAISNCKILDVFSPSREDYK